MLLPEGVRGAVWWGAPRLTAGSLCLGHRGFYGFERLRMASESGAQLLWRVSTGVRLPSERELSDGSFLSTLSKATGGGRVRAAARAGDRVPGGAARG